MRKPTETFHANKDYKLAAVAFFKIEVCGTIFKRYLQENEALRTPTLYKKINHFNIVFYMTLDRWQSF